MSQVAQDPGAQRALDRAAWIAAKINDRALRDAFIRAVTDKTLVYSEAERKQIEEGLKMEAEVTSSSALKPIKVSTPLLDKAVAMTSKDGQHSMVQSSATIRAPLQSVAAYVYCAEQEVKKILAEGSLLVNHVVEQENDHAVVLHSKMSFPRPLQDRETVTRCIYQTLPDGVIVMSFETAEHDAVPVQDGVVRCFGKRFIRFSPITASVTRFTSTGTFNLRGSIPRFVSDTLTTPAAVRSPLSALGYFIKIKETAELDASGEDALALGQLLVHEMEPVRTNKKLLESKLHVFLLRTTVLRELTDARPWFEALLHQVLVNEAQIRRKGVNGVEGFTEEDARETGAGLASLLLTKQPLTAVDVVSPARGRSGAKKSSRRYLCSARTKRA
jgi:hypothetical protein